MNHATGIGESHFSRGGSRDTSLESVEDSELCGRMISSLGLYAPLHTSDGRGLPTDC